MRKTVIMSEDEYNAVMTLLNDALVDYKAIKRKASQVTTRMRDVENKLEKALDIMSCEESREPDNADVPAGLIQEIDCSTCVHQSYFANTRCNNCIGKFENYYERETEE